MYNLCAKFHHENKNVPDFQLKQGVNLTHMCRIYLLDFFSEADNMQTTLLSPFLSEKLKDMGEVLLKNCSRYLLRA